MLHTQQPSAYDYLLVALLFIDMDSASEDILIADVKRRHETHPNQSEEICDGLFGKLCCSDIF